MKIVKLAVCFAFVVAVAAFTLLRTEAVKGQSGSLAAPTGVMASDTKYRDKVRVEWDAIRGATLYRVFRGTTSDPGTAVDIGNTPANTFLDTTATAGQTFFYWVRAENTTMVSSLSASDQGTRSNTAQQGPVPPLGPPPVPAGNPITAAKVYLGKALFWDEQMSSTRTVACGTCHTAHGGGDDLRAFTSPSTSTNPGIDQFFGGADDIVASKGVPQTNLDGTYLMSSTYGLKEQVTGRSSVSYLNAGYSTLLFWDGRASDTFRDPITNAIILNTGGALESQVLGPPVSSVEMAHTGRDWNQVAARVAESKPLAIATNIPTALNTWIGGRSYPSLFNEAFGTSDVTPVRIAMAIATYERTLYTDQAPVDLANAGITPLTPQENNGRNLFVQNECAVCHAGSVTAVTNGAGAFRYIGVRPQNDDTGRFQVTGTNGDLGRFKIPILRNVELRGTFMHNGRFNTLDQVVAFYARGGDFNAPNKDPDVRLRPVLNGSAQQQADIVAFLKRPLTDPRVTAELPPFDRPTLYSESARVPQVTGSGRVGSGGFTPAITAISPPFAGNPNFTISVSGALGNADAVLVINSSDPGAGLVIPSSGSFARVVTTTQNTGAGNGWASVSLPLSGTVRTLGKTFYARWYVVDPSSLAGFSVSQAVKFTVFGSGVFATVEADDVALD